MIKRFKDFINENKLDYTEIENLIEDSFTPMCDQYGLDFRLMEGYFVNTMGSDSATNWITHQLLDDVKFMFRDQGEKLVYKRAFQITFLKSESWSNHYVGEISDEEKVELLNKDFQEGVKKFNRMNRSDYKLTYLPEEIKPTFWQIIFYVVED